MGQEMLAGAPSDDVFQMNGEVPVGSYARMVSQFGGLRDWEKVEII
jgi:hypothetical protein